MLKKTITYTDYNGVELTEDFYFNLSKAEAIELEVGIPGGLTAMIQNIVAANDNPSIIKVFKEFILKAYGVKSPDGKRFMKTDENGRPLADKFKETEAYSELFMELATNADEASKFINGIIPSVETASKVTAMPGA